MSNERSTKLTFVKGTKGMAVATQPPPTTVPPPAITERPAEAPTTPNTGQQPQQEQPQKP